jgi:enoyl-CoA hydratase
MTVQVSSVGHVAVIELSRPECRNAIDPETAGALARAVRSFDADPQLFVAVLSGAGGHFCAGADLKAVAAGDKFLIAAEGDAPLGVSRIRVSKPVIAAIEGYAVAGGLELALWCDLRVVSTTAVLGVFCRRFGVPLVDLGMIRLPRLIGHSRAMDLILTGRAVDANEALAIGLANRVVAPGRARDAAIELAATIARHPQQCLRHDRLSALEQWDLTEGDAIRNEIRHGLATLQSGESVAGAQGFLGGSGRHGGDATSQGRTDPFR